MNTTLRSAQAGMPEATGKVLMLTDHLKAFNDQA